MAATPPPLQTKSRKTGSRPVIGSANPSRQSRCSIETSGNVVKIQINTSHEDMILKNNDYICNYVGGSGQNSPSETVDSGTCSDAEVSSTPAGKSAARLGRHDDASDDDISCDSLNSSEVEGSDTKSEPGRPSSLRDCTAPHRPRPVDTDSFYKFHLNENSVEKVSKTTNVEYEDSFAGKKYVGEDPSTEAIRSHRGTIRGVKNRVRAGIDTFHQINNTKTWQEKEAGTIVVYTTTMGIVRETAQRCLNVKKILKTHLVKFTERDALIKEVRTELKERMGRDKIELPQIYIEGHYVGDADVIEKLNESGELRNLIKQYKSLEACNKCEVCGGFGLLPCGVCNGSKKSVHRNHFNTEIVGLKCMNCDERGLVKCYSC